MQTEYFVGIDPDTEKSGVVAVAKASGRITYAKALDTASTMEYLRGVAEAQGENKDQVLVIIEDSDTSTNWHVKKLLTNGEPLMEKLYTAAAIGRSSGMAHATLRHIKEYAEGVGLRVQMQKPLRKCWKGKDRKITQEEAQQFMVGLPTRCNQEVRDAALLAWIVAGLPVRVKP